MKLYLHPFDLKTLITDDDILNSYRKQGKRKDIKHLVTISGIETQVYSDKQLYENRLFLYGVKITDSEILHTHSKEKIGSEVRHYVEIDGQKTQVFTAKQLSQNRLFLDGKQITDLNILSTYRKEGSGAETAYYVTIDGHEQRVFNAVQLSRNRLFLNGKQITNPVILATHMTEGKRPKINHYVEIDGKKTLVFTAGQLAHNRLILDGEPITDPAILASHKKEGSGNKTEHYVEIDGKKTRVFTEDQLSHNKLFLNGELITNTEIRASYQMKRNGSETKHFVTIQGILCEVEKRGKKTIAETSNEQEPAVESNLDASPRTIIDNLMNNLIESSNPPGAEETSNHGISSNTAENQNEVDVADHAAQTIFDDFDEDNDSESVDQPSLKKQRGSITRKPVEVDLKKNSPAEIIDNLMNNMISNQTSRPLAQPSNYSHPPAASNNSPMFFASQARSQNVSNDRSQDLTTTSVYDQQKNCLKAMSNWLNTLSLDAIQQQYPFCPAPIINFKSDIASLCSTVIDTVLTRLIPEDMLTNENLMKLRYIKAFQYNSATPFDHQCLDRFIKCVQNKRNSLNQPTSQTTLWKSNLR